MRHKIFFIFSCSVVFLFIIELSLRLIWGFGDPILFVEDKDFEYIYAPNQHVVRFGNRISTNEYSMRSLSLSKKDQVRILKVGDSIINGGTLTDDDSLATTLLEKQLTSRHKENVRVLNISAGSWGPDNAFAYIQRFGSFNAGMIVLVFSSHDLYDSMEHEKIVDADNSFPSKKPYFAIQELFGRYFLPYLTSLTTTSHRNSDRKIAMSKRGVDRDLINSGWNNFFNYTKNNNIELLVVLHPTLEEVRFHAYDENGKMLIRILDSAKVPYILELKNAPTFDLYRDDIHYNNKGQKFLARELYPYLNTYVNSISAKALKPGAGH